MTHDEHAQAAQSLQSLAQEANKALQACFRADLAHPYHAHSQQHNQGYAPACCCFSAAASACSWGSFSLSLSCTCLPKLLLLKAVSRVTGAAAARRMPDACSPVLDTSLMVMSPVAVVQEATHGIDVLGTMIDSQLVQ